MDDNTDREIFETYFQEDLNNQVIRERNRIAVQSCRKRKREKCERLENRIASLGFENSLLKILLDTSSESNYSQLKRRNLGIELAASLLTRQLKQLLTSMPFTNILLLLTRNSNATWDSISHYSGISNEQLEQLKVAKGSFQSLFNLISEMTSSLDKIQNRVSRIHRMQERITEGHVNSIGFKKTSEYLKYSINFDLKGFLKGEQEGDAKLIFSFFETLKTTLEANADIAYNEILKRLLKVCESKVKVFGLWETVIDSVEKVALLVVKTRRSILNISFKNRSRRLWSLSGSLNNKPVCIPLIVSLDTSSESGKVTSCFMSAGCLRTILNK